MPVSNDLNTSIPLLDLVNPVAVMGLSSRSLMNNLATLSQRVKVVTADGTVLSKKRWFGVDGSDLSNSSILALSIAL